MNTMVNLIHVAVKSISLLYRFFPDGQFKRFVAMVSIWKVDILTQDKACCWMGTRKVFLYCCSGRFIYIDSALV